MRASDRWKRLQGDWSVLTYYQRFESAVALVLTAVVGVIIVVAPVRLVVSVVGGLVAGAFRWISESFKASSARC